MMKTILALRGQSSKKQKEAFERGMLWVKRAPLRYSRTDLPIQDLVGSLEDRCKASAADQLVHKDESNLEHLKVLHCPSCQSKKSTRNLKLKTRSQVSNLKCEMCCQTTNAVKWSCNCGLKWQKCERHELRECAPAPPRNKRKKLEDLRGCDAPLPKFRKRIHEPRVTPTSHQQGADERIRVALPPHGKLASRFPHLVKRDTSDQREVHG